jgi:urease accessory protein
MKGYVELDTRLSRKQTTVTASLRYAAPYLVMHPFKRRSWTEYLIMSSSAGLLAQDESRFSFHFGAGTHTKIRTQSYEKVMDTRGSLATKSMNITLDEHAVASVLPLPTIPFAGSSFKSTTHIDMNPQSALLVAEVTACGRVARGESFAMERFLSTTTVTLAGEMVLRDGLLLDPSLFVHTGPGQWGEYTHAATLYIHLPVSVAATRDYDALIALLRQMPANAGQAEIGVTRALAGLSVRIMTMSGENTMRLLEELEGAFMKCDALGLRPRREL